LIDALVIARFGSCGVFCKQKMHAFNRFGKI
jgi:hypothetical protein